MSTFNEDQFKEGLVSELSLFDLPSTQNVHSTEDDIALDDQKICCKFWIEEVA